jgi:hypothetical protein
MKTTIIAGAVLLAACGGTTATSDTTTTTMATTTVATTTTTSAPATTVDQDERIQVMLIESMFTAERQVEICLMMLDMRAGGLQERMIVDLGVESFASGMDDPLFPAGEDALRDILWGCFK